MTASSATSSSAATVDVHLTEEQWLDAITADCLEGLTSTPKWLSPVWFYDETGSKLFDEITRLPEYYPTRAEAALLAAHAIDIADCSGAEVLVELGSGTSDKTEHLLDAMSSTGQLERYVPFDVSGATLRDASERLLERYPALDIHAVVGDFRRHLREIPTRGRRVIAFLGGTIGNLDSGERGRLLRDVRGTMSAGDRFLLGVDLVKDTETLLRAYDDADGITAAFNRNALDHLNDRLGADFVSDRFEHIAGWNGDRQWIEMRLRSLGPQTVDLGALDARVDFADGEELRTEISAKFTPAGIEHELADAGFAVEQTWAASPGFLLVLARPRG